MAGERDLVADEGVNSEDVQPASSGDVLTPTMGPHGDPPDAGPVDTDPPEDVPRPGQQLAAGEG